MYAYLLPADDCPHWALVLALSFLSKTFDIVATGEMPEPESGITIITEDPIPDEQLNALNLQAFE